MSLRCPSEYKIDIAIGARLRFLRISRGISMQEMASAAQITGQQLQKYETGANRISVSRLHTMCETLGITLTEFLDSTLVAREGGDSETAPDKGLAQLMAHYSKIGNPKFRAMLLGFAKTLAKNEH